MENLSQIEEIPACSLPVQDSIPQAPARNTWTYLNYPLDLSLAIVVEVLEQEVSACRAKGG